MAGRAGASSRAARARSSARAGCPREHGACGGAGRMAASRGFSRPWRTDRSRPWGRTRSARRRTPPAPSGALRWGEAHAESPSASRRNRSRRAASSRSPATWSVRARPHVDLDRGGIGELAAPAIVAHPEPLDLGRGEGHRPQPGSGTGPCRTSRRPARTAIVVVAPWAGTKDVPSGALSPPRTLRDNSCHGSRPRTMAPAPGGFT